MKNITRIGVYGVARKGHEILLVTQTSGPYASLLDLPGGGIEFGETIEQALRREFLEEVGMTFDSMELITNLTSLIHMPAKANSPSGTLHRIGLIYSVTGLRTVQTGSELKYQWIDARTLQEHSVTPFVWSSL